MIEQGVLEVCQSFDLSHNKMITVLAEQGFNKYFRQYSAWFDVVVGRNDQIGTDELGEEYMKMYENVFERGIIDAETKQIIDKFGVEYIITENRLKTVVGFPNTRKPLLKKFVER